MYADLNPSTLDEPSSRATAELKAVTDAYEHATGAGITLGGQYID